MDDFSLYMDNSMNDSLKKREGFLGQRIVVIPNNIRKNVTENSLINSLYLTSTGYYPHATNHFRERTAGADEFILIYCLEGFGKIEIEGETFKISPNHFFIIPPSIPHKYKADKRNPWSIRWLHFRGTRAQYLYNRYRKINEDSKVVHVPFQEFRINLFEHTIDTLEKGYSKHNIEYINITLWQLLSSFVYPNFFQKIGYQSNEADFADKAIQYMQNAIEESISVEELAQHVNYSVSYFHSSFKEKTGFSPIHYFNQLKIQKACQYLSFSGLSIKEISHKLGFNDPFYFSRLFKNMMGLSPNKYRQIYKN